MEAFRLTSAKPMLRQILSLTAPGTLGLAANAAHPVPSTRLPDPVGAFAANATNPLNCNINLFFGNAKDMVS